MPKCQHFVFKYFALLSFLFLGGFSTTAHAEKRKLTIQNMGGLSKPIIRRVMQAYMPKIRQCYVKTLAQNPSLSGILKVSFYVKKTGIVRAVHASENTLGSKKLTSCILLLTRTFIFPKAEKLTIITYPFVFRVRGQKSKKTLKSRLDRKVKPRKVSVKPRVKALFDKANPILVHFVAGITKAQAVSLVSPIKSALKGCYLNVLKRRTLKGSPLTRKKIAVKLALMFGKNGKVKARLKEFLGSDRGMRYCILWAFLHNNFGKRTQPAIATLTLSFSSSHLIQYWSKRGTVSSVKIQKGKKTLSLKGLSIQDLTVGVQKKINPFVESIPSKMLTLKLNIPFPQRFGQRSIFWRRFQITRSGWYILGTTGKNDIDCTLYNQQSTLLENDDNSGASRNCRIVYRLEKGTYFFKAKLLRKKESSFVMFLKSFSSRAIVLGRPVKSYLFARTDLFLYHFDVKKPGLYQISTTGKADVKCSLIDQKSHSLKALVVDDDSGKRMNCSLSWYLTAGRYQIFIEGSLFGRGAFYMNLQQLPILTYKEKTFVWEHLQSHKASSETEVHRYRFRLDKKSALSFFTNIGLVTPQLILKNVSGQIIAMNGYYADRRNRKRILGVSLPKGSYSLELRLSGRKNRTYKLLISRSKFRHLGVGKSIRLSKSYINGRKGFRFERFRVAFPPNSYKVLEAKHPNLVSCVLETADSQKVVGLVHYFRPMGFCRIAGTRLSGLYYLRLTFSTHKGRKKSSLKPSKAPSSLQKGFVRYLVAQPRVIPKTGAFKVFFKKGIQFFLLTIKRPNLYRVSIDGLSGSFCRLESLKGKNIFGITADLNSCDVKVLLRKGFYLLRVQSPSAKKALLILQKKMFKQQFLTMNKNIYIGPIQGLGQNRVSLRIKRKGFYQITTKSFVLGRAKAICLIQKVGGRVLSRQKPSFKRCQVIALFDKGLYHFSIKKAGGMAVYKLKARPIFIQKLSLAQLFSAKISKAKGVQLFSTMIPRDGYYKLKTKGKIDVNCSITDLSGKQLAYDDDSGKGRNCLVLQYLSAGRYLVKIQSHSKKEDSYSLLFESTTSKITLLEQCRGKGRLFPGSEPSDYQFQIRRGGTYLIETQILQGKADPKCYLLKPDGSLLGWNDDSGKGRNCKIAKHLKPGVYRIRVITGTKRAKGVFGISVRPKGIQMPNTICARYVNSAGSLSKKLPFFLKKGLVKLLPKSGCKGTLVQASMLLPGQQILKGKVERPSWFEFSLKVHQAGSYRIETTGSLDPKCYLHDSSGQIMAVNDDGGLASNCRLKMMLPSGSYKLKVFVHPVRRSGGFHVCFLKI